MTATPQAAYSYRPGLDGVRAAAVSVVILGHAWQRVAPGGAIGVDIFFVLSGYLITTLLLVERSEFQRLDLPRFYGRRALRLFPPLALMLVFVVIYFRPRVDDVLVVVFYVANWARVGGNDLGPLGPTWSLSVEEQFYILWPLVLVAAFLWAKQPVGAVVVVALIGCVVAFLDRALLPGDGARVGNATDTRMDALLVGALLAAAAVLWPEITRRVGVVGAWPAMVILAVIVFAGEEAGPWFYSFVAVAAAMPIAAVALAPTGVLARALSLGLLVWIGQVSYGMYLWHFPLQFVANDLSVPLKARLPFVFLAALAVASLSFVLVERPLVRRYRAGLQPGRSDRGVRRSE